MAAVPVQEYMYVHYCACSTNACACAHDTHRILHYSHMSVINFIPCNASVLKCVYAYFCMEMEFEHRDIELWFGLVFSELRGHVVNAVLHSPSPSVEENTSSVVVSSASAVSPVEVSTVCSRHLCSYFTSCLFVG